MTGADPPPPSTRPPAGGEGVRAATTEVTEDRLLDGRVVLRQPAKGYRAATDAVLLAAAVTARRGESVLDLGCGAGAAALCLATRITGLLLTGLERAPEYAALARENAALNGAEMRVIEGDVAAPPPALRSLSFDHVMMNPPWYPQAAATPSPVALRDGAHREGEAGLVDWAGTGLARLKPGGRLSVIQRAERLPDLLAAIAGRAGSTVVRPLASRAGHPAKRVLLQTVKGARGPFRLSAPLVLHEGAAHLGDGDDFSEAARGVLRDAAGLTL